VVLHNTARVLKLPTRTAVSYLSLFPTSSLSGYQHPSLVGTPSRTPSSNGVHLPPLDEKYTGHILVSGYNVSYVLPRELPPKMGSSSAVFEGDTFRDSPFSSMRSRRNSVGERNVYQFMAAIELWVPLLTKPPRFPFLVSQSSHKLGFA
jgi:hypothetical protein